MRLQPLRPDPRTLPPDLREWYEERAAIREHDGKQTRAEAEAAAWREVCERMNGGD